MRLAIVTGVLGMLFYLLLECAEQSQRIAQKSYGKYDPPPLSRLDPKIINLLTFGHRGLYDDFLEIWVIQFLADIKTSESKPEKVAEILEYIANVNPKIESIYLYGCLSLIMRWKRPDLCQNILIPGIKTLTESWRLPFTLAFVFALPLNQPKKAIPLIYLALQRPKPAPFLSKWYRNLLAGHNITSQQANDALSELLGGSRPSKYNQMIQPQGHNEAK